MKDKSFAYYWAQKTRAERLRKSIEQLQEKLKEIETEKPVEEYEKHNA